MSSFRRILRTGLSLLRNRAAARLAALRFNPSRELGLDDDFGPDYDVMLARILNDVKPPR